MSAPLPKSISFNILNGANVGDEGTIMNAVLTSGKWQLSGQNVGTVNKIKFNRSLAATFAAVETSPGDEVNGSFEMYENGTQIAEITFAIPFSGENKFNLTPTNPMYVCNHNGFTSSGSPVVAISCNKTS
ncbi:uncharacterized protein [Epargyreus clarus]|uniref:uncharacterized protein n=1 Tax=Epargyreus clarus TaxID=520877 RepID=UPI003C2DB9B1